VGIIHEDGEQTFDRTHREAAENVVAAMGVAERAGSCNMSAMGA
jgi:hypothetical protein